MRPWSDDIDPTTIPDEVLRAERARRNALRRQTYTGGVYWKRHNPSTPRCRCVDCMQARQLRTAELRRDRNSRSAGAPDAAAGAPAKRRAQKKSASSELLPIQLGEHQTRRGLRAFVVRISSDRLWRVAYGFVELMRNGRVYRRKKIWSQENGEETFSHGRRSFDLVRRIEPRLTAKQAAAWTERHSVIGHWEFASE